MAPRFPASISYRNAFWAALVAGTIFLASSRSVIAAPHSPFDFLRVDKVGHFAIYGLLGTLLCRLGRGWKGALWAVVATSAFGASDEWHQSFVPGRGVELMDWVADTLGGLIAVGLYMGWRSYRDWLEKVVWRRDRGVENPGAAAKIPGP